MRDGRGPGFTLGISLAGCSPYTYMAQENLRARMLLFQLSPLLLHLKEKRSQ